jgi:hypothetical protein
MALYLFRRSVMQMKQLIKYKNLCDFSCKLIHWRFCLLIWMQLLVEIRVRLELNDYTMQQRRLAHMRFLGELYNYECIGSSVIFDTLDLIIVFGHRTPEVNYC